MHILPSRCLTPLALEWLLQLVGSQFFCLILWVHVHAKSLSRVRLCDLMDCNLPGSSVQARILEWVAVPFSGQILYHLSHQGNQ